MSTAPNEPSPGRGRKVLWAALLVGLIVAVASIGVGVGMWIGGREGRTEGSASPSSSPVTLYHADPNCTSDWEQLKRFEATALHILQKASVEGSAGDAMRQASASLNALSAHMSSTSFGDWTGFNEAESALQNAVGAWDDSSATAASGGDGQQAAADAEAFYAAYTKATSAYPSCPEVPWTTLDT